MQPLTLSLIQTATAWHDAQANCAHFEALLRGVADDVDVVVLPEMFSTGFTMASAEVAQTMEGDTVSWMRERAVQGGYVVCGSVVIEDQGAFYNRLIWMRPDGSHATYDKRHRFRMAGEHEFYSAGQTRTVVEVAGWRVCLSVCYDLRFPVWLRNLNDYDLLLCVANWPAARRAAWSSLLAARAIENQAYVCGVNIVGTDGNGVQYSGGTGAWAPDGELLAEAVDDALMLQVTLAPDRLLSLRADFPVWQDADRFELQR